MMKPALAVLAALVLLAACGPSTDPQPLAGSGSTAPSTPQITVLAAASLTEAFTEIGQDFEAETHTAVTFSFGSSATLATQITQGAPADVFAAASPATMQRVIDAGAAVGHPQDFAANTLMIAVPRGNPGRVQGLADFADVDLRIAVCAPQAPCGAATAEVFAAAGIIPKPDTEEADVKATLAKVSADEVDAALVYRTDVVAAQDRVEGIEFAEAAAAINRYPIATLTEAPQPQAAQAFVDYVVSAKGQAVLGRAGFAAP